MRITQQQFQENCPGGLVEIRIVRNEDGVHMLLSALAGDPDAEILASAINTWFQVVTAEQCTPECLFCGKPFESTIAAFIVISPYANPKNAMVTATCENCSHKVNSDAETLASLKTIWPSMTVHEEPSTQ